MFEPGELHTETFTNSQGWTVVRVTHLASGESVERERTKTLVSSVQAQRECIAELRDRVTMAGAPKRDASPAADLTVSRQEFDELVARVLALEQRLG